MDKAPQNPLEKQGSGVRGQGPEKPQNPEPKTQNPLSESLAWLDFCLGETRAALEAVKAAALAELRRDGGVMSMARYCDIVEAGSRIITLKGMAKKWGAGVRGQGSGGGEDE